MGEIATDDLTWAEQAAADGRSLEFIAGVLGVTTRKLPPVVKKRAKANADLSAKTVWHAEAHNDIARARAEKLFAKAEPETEKEPDIAAPWARPPALAPEERRDRRRFLLACRFARHWPMYWFLRGKGMRGRTLRSIYGSECVIRMVGGGVDDHVPQ